MRRKKLPLQRCFFDSQMHFKVEVYFKVRTQTAVREQRNAERSRMKPVIAKTDRTMMKYFLLQLVYSASACPSQSLES